MRPPTFDSIRSRPPRLARYACIAAATLSALFFGFSLILYGTLFDRVPVDAYHGRDASGHPVLHPVPGATPEGVGSGSRLLAVDGMPVSSATTPDEVELLLRGPVGHGVTVTLESPDGSLGDVDLTFAPGLDRTLREGGADPQALQAVFALMTLAVGAPFFVTGVFFLARMGDDRQGLLLALSLVTQPTVIGSTMQVALLVPWAGVPINGLRIVSWVSLVVDRAHALGLVHGDVEPANILLARVERGTRVKLADFGLARVIASTGPGPSATGLGPLVGTASYMAPELWLGRPADGKTDVYGLGVTLYRALTGTVPFRTGGDLRALARLHVEAEARSVADIRTDVPILLAAAVSDALAKDPRHRPTATELSEHLAQATVPVPSPARAMSAS